MAQFRHGADDARRGDGAAAAKFSQALAEPTPGKHARLDRTAFNQGAGRVGPIVGKAEKGLDVEVAVAQQMVEHARRFGDEGPQPFPSDAVAHVVLKVGKRSLNVVLGA